MCCRIGRKGRAADGLAWGVTASSSDMKGLAGTGELSETLSLLR